jgi:hypothetical protein
MKTDARTLKQGTRGRPQLLEPPGADPHAGWCGRGEAAKPPPIPIAFFFCGGVTVLQGVLKKCGAGCGVFVVRSW